MLTKFKYKEFNETLRILRAYLNLISFYKARYLPHNKNWEEYAFGLYSRGLISRPVPFSSGNKKVWVDFKFDFFESVFEIVTNNKLFQVELSGQDLFIFRTQTNGFLKRLKLPLIEENTKGETHANGVFQKDVLKIFHQVLTDALEALMKLKSKFLEETSSINFWPHHLDLSMLYFSGAILNGTDPADWSNSREQINFGFSAGDADSQVPYFYVTAFPFPEKALNEPLINKAYWHRKDWFGALLKYESGLNPSLILEFFETVFKIIKRAKSLEN